MSSLRPQRLITKTAFTLLLECPTGIRKLISYLAYKSGVSSMPKIPVKVVSWNDVVDWSTTVAQKVKEDNYAPDIIVAVARGGLVPSRIIADVLGVLDIISLKVEHWVETASKNPVAKVKYPYEVDLSGKRILVVDDICDTGDSIVLASTYAKERMRSGEVKTATMQVIKPGSKVIPDYYASIVTEWAWYMYPWNYWEDEINLTKKLIDEVGPQDEATLSAMFRESYGVEPPIRISHILSEISRRDKAKKRV